jgi:hypothetical protein
MRLLCLSIRGVVVAIAILAMALGAIFWVERRRSRFTRLAQFHHDQIVGLAVGRNPPTGLGLSSFGPRGKPLTKAQQRDDERHFGLFLKYKRAASEPWRAIEESVGR